MTRQLIAIFIAAASWQALHPQATDSLTVSAEALADRMLEQLGGIDMWRESNTLYLKERIWSHTFPETVEQQIWRDLQYPRTRFHLKSESLDRVRAWDSQQGWGRLETGKFYGFDSQRIQNEIAIWKRNLLTLCFAIANQHDTIQLKLLNERSFQVLEQDGSVLCQIELDVNGAPIRWSSSGGPEAETYIYGPLKAFGEYRLPAWWTYEQGHWRYELLEVLGPDDIPEWHSERPPDFEIKD